MFALNECTGKSSLQAAATLASYSPALDDPMDKSINVSSSSIAQKMFM